MTTFLVLLLFSWRGRFIFCAIYFASSVGYSVWDCLFSSENCNLLTIQVFWCSFFWNRVCLNMSKSHIMKTLIVCVLFFFLNVVIQSVADQGAKMTWLLWWVSFYCGWGWRVEKRSVGLWNSWGCLKLCLTLILATAFWVFRNLGTSPPCIVHFVPFFISAFLFHSLPFYPPHPCTLLLIWERLHLEANLLFEWHRTLCFMPNQEVGVLMS